MTSIQVQKVIFAFNVMKIIGEIIEFCNLGDVNADMNKLVQAITTITINDEEPQLANSMLVLFVRGLFSKFVFSYVQFPCTALSGNQMYEPFWEVVKRFEFCGFKVCVYYVSY